MGSLRNVSNSCQPILKSGNKDRCLIIRQSTTRNLIIDFYDFE